MSRQMFMLGLDSIDWVLVNEWAAEGRLPVLSRLLSESHVLMFDESVRAMPGCVWTDIATGVSAATHGYIHEIQVRSNSYRTEEIDSSVVAVPPFYKTLSDAGVRSAVVDFPVDYPLSDFNGVQVVDWGTEFQLWRFETKPAGFAAQIVSTYGKHPLTNYRATKISLSDLLALRRRLQRGIEIKQQFAIDLLRKREYDFVFFNFAELHKAGHFFWRFHDHKHAEFTTAEPELVDALRSLYEQMDKAVGALLRHLRDDDDLIVITDRGMHANHRGDHLVDQVLTKIELAVPRGPVRQGASRSRVFSSPAMKKVFRFVGRHLPDRVHEALVPFHRAAIGETPPWDWSQTKVFGLPNVGNTQLRVNLAGVCPNGIVSPGAEYDAVVEAVSAQFRALINIETGEPAVDDIFFPAQQFSGPFAAELPDIAIAWNLNATPINGVTSDDVGTITGKQHSRRSGNHRSLGFALLRGPSFGVNSGSQYADGRQIAPLVLKRFGIPVPAHYEMEPRVSVEAA